MNHLKYLPLAVVILLTGCANTPEDTVKTFYKDVAVGDQDAALGLLHPNATLLLGDAKVRGILKQQQARISGCGGLADVAVTVTDTPNSGKQGTAVVSYKGSCKAVTERVHLVKVDDKWRIAP